MASALSTKLGLEVEMYEGRRITSKEQLEVVCMVYAGLANKKLISSMQAQSIDALGLSGADLNLIKAEKRAVKKIYIQRLDDLATGINFKNLPKRFVLNDIICANLLNGFLSSNSYKYTFTDDAVRNESFLNY